MDNVQERAKLAEAMGWTGVEGICGYPPGAGEDKRWLLIPDPFTDANDDYAVLVWINGRPEMLFAFRDAMLAVTKERLALNRIEEYCLGDFARAALKALESA